MNSYLPLVLVAMCIAFALFQQNVDDNDDDDFGGGMLQRLPSGSY